MCSSDLDKDIASFNRDMDFLWTIINGLNSKNDGWILVDERLPEDGTYLCTLDGELVGEQEPFTGMCGIENGKWDEEGCVIAWKPLPEPYKGE